MPYFYKTKSKRPPTLPLNRLPPVTNPDDLIPLTGWVHGKDASDLEERSSRSLRLLKVEFQFQVDVQITGNEFKKNVDFMVNQGLILPFEVKGEIGHGSSSQRAKDEIREAFLNEYFSSIGVQPIQSVWWYELQTQEASDNRWRQLLT